MTRLALATVAALLLLSAPAAGKSATVTDIADGDTIEVRVGDRVEDVRLVGIDTPEVYFGAECGGAAASRSIKRMLSVGDRVELIRDRSQDNRDAYDRLLRYVERHGRDVGRKQVRKGWAKVYVFEDRFNRVGSYRRAQRVARARDRAVWRRATAARRSSAGSRSRSAMVVADRVGLARGHRGGVPASPGRGPLPSPVRARKVGDGTPSLERGS